MEAQLCYEVKALTIDHIPEILALQESVLKTLTDKKSYYQEADDYFARSLKGGNGSAGLFMQKNLIGYNIISFPDDDAQNLGCDVGLSGAALSKVAHWGPAAIHPSFQGQGLLKIILAKQLQQLMDKGYEHVCLTIAPQNYSSLCTAMRQGFLIKQIKLKFGNLLRYVLHLDMKRSFKKSVCQVRVAGSDLESQRFLLDLGFYGFAVESESSKTEILFGHDGLIG